MSCNNPNHNNNNIGQWIAIAVIFCFAWPIGLILAGIKLYSKREEARRSQRTQQYFQGTSQPKYGQTIHQRPTGEDFQPQPRPTDAYTRQNLISKLTSTKAGRGLFTGGTITLVVGLISGVVTLLENLWMISYGMALELISDLTGAFVIAAVGAVLMYAGNRKIKNARKYREYFALIGDNQAISLRRLSSATGRSFQELCDDLSILLGKGAFGDRAYLDLSTQYLILNATGAQQVAEQRQAAQAEQAAQAAVQAEQEDPSTALLREIRRVNDDIPDPHLTQQINRIEEITRQILLYQKGHPEAAPQLHSFLSYYLPTTLKILNAYADMEKQSIQGKNITETRLRIETMMDKVVGGFETQLDQLYAGDRMDITSEISVLEQMMAQDGLTSDFSFGATQTQ